MIDPNKKAYAVKLSPDFIEIRSSLEPIKVQVSKVVRNSTYEDGSCHKVVLTSYCYLGGKVLKCLSREDYTRIARQLNLKSPQDKAVVELPRSFLYRKWREAHL